MEAEKFVYLGREFTEVEIEEGVIGIPRKVFLSMRARLYGKEVPDPTPVEAPLLQGPPTIQQMVQAWVRHEMGIRAEQAGFGSFEEEDDFEEDDDFEAPPSGYEEEEIPTEEPLPDMPEDTQPSSVEDQVPVDEPPVPGDQVAGEAPPGATEQ